MILVFPDPVGIITMVFAVDALINSHACACIGLNNTVSRLGGSCFCTDKTGGDKKSVNGTIACESASWQDIDSSISLCLFLAMVVGDGCIDGSGTRNNNTGGT